MFPAEEGSKRGETENIVPFCVNFDANTPWKLPAVYTLKIQQKEDKEEICMKFNSPYSSVLS